MANEFIIRKGFKSQEDSQITGSISLSGSFKDQESSSGTAGQVLSSTVSGSQWVDVGGTGIGDVTKTGTIVANQIAIWNNATNQLRSDPTFVIDSNNKIILYQPKISGGAADISTSNIGGGNLANVTGAGNTGFGKNNLNSLTQGFSNNAFGEDALLSLTTGTFNVAVGSLALKTNLIGGSNTAIGNSAYRNGTGSNNTSIGAQSLFGATTGGDNVAVGYKAIAVGTGISFATAVGTSAIEYNIGNGNTAIGYHALRGPSSGTVNGNSNTAVGNGSLKNLTTSTNSTALGESSGQNVTTGGNNTLIGTNAGSTMTTNSNNTFVGVNAGNGLNSTSAFNGNGNTFIGKFAGSSTTTATDCVIIGSNNGSTIAALSNNIIISDGDGNNRIQVDSGGNVGIGTSAGQKVVVGGGTNGRVRIKVDEGTNNFGKFDFSTSDSATSSATMIAEITANITGTTPLTSELSFATNSGDSLSNKLTIESGGEVKINTAGSGTSKLQVVGGIRNWNSALTLSSRLETDGLYFSGAQDVYVVSQQALNFYAGNALKMSISSLGTATFSGTTSANVVISRDNMFVGLGQLYIGAENSNTDDTYRQSVGSGIFKIQSRESGTWTDRLTISSGGDVVVNSGFLEINSMSTSTATEEIDKMYFKKSHPNGVSGTYVLGEIRSKTYGGYAGGLNFYTGRATTPGSYASTFAMAIDNFGNVGIGTDSPSFYGLNFKNILTISSAAATTDYAVIELAGGSAAAGGIQFGTQTVRQAGIFSLNGSDLAFYTNSTNSGSSLVERMRLTTSTNTLVLKGTGTTGSNYLQFQNSSSTVQGYVGYGSSGSNALYIAQQAANSDIIMYNGGATRLTIESGGVVDVAGTLESGGNQRFGGGPAHGNSSSPGITTKANGTAGVYWNSNGSGGWGGGTFTTNNSDRNMKTNIIPMDINALNVIGSLETKYFNWTEKSNRGDTTIRQAGIIAQDLKELMPEGVFGTEWDDNDEDTNGLSLNSNATTALFIKAIQEQQTIIEDLKARIETLEG